ncbi:MAG: SdiA-regulated domain-containing protein [Saprospiraceae bacterium]|nr:SdiA-regulated domain-containing protein [Saprospiraceae bacterium]
MLLKNVFLAIFLIMQTCSEQSSKGQNTVSDVLPYDLSKPSTSFDLATPLHEISGLTASPNAEQLACLQDEIGQLFYIDKKTGKATPSVIFQNSGDFEGIEFVGDTLWAVTSKGKLFKMWHLDKTPFDIQVFKVESLRNANIEGLGYNRQTHQLLLAAKGEKTDGATLRTIWAFDTQQTTPSPKESMTVSKVFDVQLADFQSFLKQKTDKRYAKLTKDYIENPTPAGFEFGPSGIAVQPQNGHTYIVSATNRTLIVLDAAGKILDMAKLDKTLFPQPEGLCFDADGTLYISNEAKDGSNANLLVFNKQAK